MSAPIRAPAKVNTFLAVTGRRDDGFHELVTVLQTVELCDELEVALRARRTDAAPGAPDVTLELLGSGPGVPADARNLAVRAAEALLREAGAAGDVGVSIRLHKRIPAGGGLGGGSSDAAAVLAALDALLARPLGPSGLQRLAARLGSDVPFFLVGGTALCTGRGEIVTPIAPPAPHDVTLLMPPFGTSTAAVYGAFAPSGGARPPAPSLDSLAEMICGAGVEALAALHRNDLTSAARHVEPRLGALLDATGLHLSGSGSTLFGYGDHDAALQAACPSALICRVRARTEKA